MSNKRGSQCLGLAPNFEPAAKRKKDSQEKDLNDQIGSFVYHKSIEHGSKYLHLAPNFESSPQNLGNDVSKIDLKSTENDESSERREITTHNGGKKIFLNIK